MEDFRTYHEKKLGWWLEERATVPCILPKDGLLAVFLRRDVEAFFDQTFPSKTYKNGDKVWFFNETRDRECAEVDGDRVVANPSLLIQHFMGRK